MKTRVRIRRVLAAFAAVLFAFTASAQVIINEVCADNETAFNVDGDFPDYIELYNTNATTSANIAAWKLSLDTTKLNNHNFTYIFPANTLIPPRTFLIVYCDGNTNQRYHTRFNIPRDGGEDWRGQLITLLNQNNQTRDSVRLGFQVADHSLARIPDGHLGTFVLCRTTPGLANVQVALGNRSRIRINEWMPSRDTQPDWFEIYNPEPNPVSLSGLVFSDRLNVGSGCTNKAIAGNSFLGAGGFLRFDADDKPTNGIHELDFKLSSGADQIILFASNRSNHIHRIFWPDPTGRQGQTNAAELFISYGWLPDGNTNDLVIRFGLNRDTPAESNFLPIDEIVINEVLAHADPPLEDAIELHNPTAMEVDISGWWLSDDRDIYNKFKIPPNTRLPPGGYIAFYEQQRENVINGFNTNGLGTFPSFALSSSQGDQVYLFETTNTTGKLTGRRRGVDFPASANGVSYGRYIIPTTGESDFIPLQTLTFGSDVVRTDPTNRLDEFRSGLGAPNSLPLFGPLVVSEIMYHPPDFISGTNITQNEIDEYVEIYNMSLQTVLLYDPLFPTNKWRVRGEIEFDFPTNVSLGPGRSLVLVNFGLTNTLQLNNFRTKYNVPAGVQIFGAYRGNLSDGGGAVEIERPDFPQQGTGFVPYLRVDRLRYNDELPWPVEPDGVRIERFNPQSLGHALSRKQPELYGSDPASWLAAYPSPGRQIISNYVSTYESTVRVIFQGLAGSSYTLECRDGLESGTWVKVRDFPAETTSGPREYVTTPPPARRFYRVVTPMQP